MGFKTLYHGGATTWDAPTIQTHVLLKTLEMALKWVQIGYDFKSGFVLL